MLHVALIFGGLLTVPILAGGAGLAALVYWLSKRKEQHGVPVASGTIQALPPGDLISGRIDTPEAHTQINLPFFGDERKYSATISLRNTSIRDVVVSPILRHLVDGGAASFDFRAKPVNIGASKTLNLTYAVPLGDLPSGFFAGSNVVVTLYAKTPEGERVLDGPVPFSTF